MAILTLGMLLSLPGMVVGKTVRTRLGRPARAIQVRVSPFTIPANQEREVCQAVVLPNRVPLDVDELQFATPVGHGYITHHFALFVDDNDDLASLPKRTVDAPGCVGVGQNFGAILGGVQAPRAAISFPPGVGFTFQPHQIVLLNLHYINGTAEPPAGGRGGELVPCAARFNHSPCSRFPVWNVPHRRTRRAGRRR